METGNKATSLIREDLCEARSSSTTYLGDVPHPIKIAGQLVAAASLAGSALKKMLNGQLAGPAALQASIHTIIQTTGHHGHVKWLTDRAWKNQVPQLHPAQTTQTQAAQTTQSQEIRHLQGHQWLSMAD